MKQLPVLKPDIYRALVPWDRSHLTVAQASPPVLTGTEACPTDENVGTAPSPGFLPPGEGWGEGALTIRDWILPRVLELTYTAWDLQPFAEDCGDSGPPFIWDPERRFQLRCELDAAFFHLYGIARDDTDHVLDTFPIVRRHDEKAHGEYRTKRVILEIYDALAEATVTGRPYVSPLGPPRRADGA